MPAAGDALAVVTILWMAFGIPFLLFLLTAAYLTPHGKKGQ